MGLLVAFSDMVDSSSTQRRRDARSQRNAEIHFPLCVLASWRLGVKAGPPPCKVPPTGGARGYQQHRAHHWGTDGLPVDLGVLPGGDWSEATAINDAVPVQVVGWSRTSLDTNSVVGFISGGPGTTMVSVQDQHLFYGSTNWHLTRPVDINNWSYILGNGTYEGTPASWLLIPLCPP